MTVLAYRESAVSVAAALVVARVTDGAGGRARPVGAVSTTSPHVHAHVAAGSYLVLSGRPDLAVPELAATGYALTARLEFDDAPAAELVFALPAGTVLPLRAPDVAIELPATTLAGTVRAAAFPYDAVAGAQIGVGQVEAAQVLAGLRIPLAVAHPAGTPVSKRSIAPAAPATTLTVAADGGALTVVVDDVAGFTGPNAVVLLGDPATAEHVRVAAADVAERLLTLAVPLRRSRPAGDVVRAHKLGAAGAATTLARAAVAGDGVIGLTAALTAGVLELAGAGGELRATGALTDAAGRWRMDGIRAAGRLTLAAGAPGFADTTVVYDVDYRRPNLIDLDLTT